MRFQVPCAQEAKKRRHETRASMKAGDAQGRTTEQEATENFQEAAETDLGWVAFTTLSSNNYSLSVMK